MQSIMTSLDSSTFKLGLAVTRAPTPELAENRIRTLRTRLQNSANRLGGIEPPADVAEPHAQLEEAVRALDSELDEAEAATREPDYPGWPSFLDDLRATPAARQLARATRAIAAEGYDIRAGSEG
jgi:hypothetical protein